LLFWSPCMLCQFTFYLYQSAPLFKPQIIHNNNIMEKYFYFDHPVWYVSLRFLHKYNIISHISQAKWHNYKVCLCTIRDEQQYCRSWTLYKSRPSEPTNKLTSSHLLLFARWCRNYYLFPIYFLDSCKCYRLASATLFV